MSQKDEILQDIVALAKHHSISADEIKHALEVNTHAPSRPSASILSKLLGYLGGIFVFAGISVFISMYWHDFGSAARVIVTLGVGLVAFIMGVLCLNDARYEKTATPLFIVASILQPMGVLVMLQEYGNGGDARHGVLFMAAYMLIQQGLTFVAKHLTVLAFPAILFGVIFFAYLFDIWNFDEEVIGFVLGASLLCVAYALQNSKHAAIAPFWYFVGAALLMWAAFELLQNTPIEVFFLGLCALMIFISTHARSRTLLGVGTLSMFSYIGYFTAEHFANTLGWPIALVIIGIALIGLGALAVGLNNKYIKQ